MYGRSPITQKDTPEESAKKSIGWISISSDKNHVYGGDCTFPRNRKPGRPRNSREGSFSALYVTPVPWHDAGLYCLVCVCLLLQHVVTMRTMDDGSFEEMLEERNLADSLGSKESVRTCRRPCVRASVFVFLSVCLSYSTPVSC